MSLINQMLRDLETRRKSGASPLPSVEKPVAAAAQVISYRPLIIFCCGLLIIGLIWLGLDLLSRQLTTPRATVKQINAAAPAERIAIQPKTAASIEIAEIKTKSAVAEALPTVKEEIAVVMPVAKEQASAPASTPEPLAPSPEVGQLLNLNLLEARTSTRLMLEFEQLPAYSWKFMEQDNKQLQVVFKQGTLLPTLVVPKVNGPLLKQLSLQTEKPNLRLLVKADLPLQVELLKLPEDRFHGPRLLLEFSRRVTVPTVVKEKKSPIVILPSEEKTSPQPAAQDKRVSKTLAKLTLKEQAEQTYREALQQLQRQENLAAETSLAHVLTLQPKMLAARLQLVALLQEAGRSADVDKQLIAGLKLHPENPSLRKSYARRLMDDGHLAAAADLLQSAPRPTVSSDLEYHALLAALQQDLGQHRAAAENYRQLLAYRPQAALWWMGLAISLDQSSNYAMAKEAYLKALSLPGLREDLQDYVKNRLQKL